MGTAIQRPEARSQRQENNVDDSGFNHSRMTGTDASRFTNDASRVLCDPNSQSCYATAPENQPLFTPAAKVIGGVLAASSAASVGMMLGLNGEPVLEGEMRIAKWIGAAEVAVQDGNFAAAADQFERAADVLSTDLSAPDKLQRALFLFDSVIENRKKGIDVISGIQASADYETTINLLSSASTDMVQLTTVHALIDQTAYTKNEKVKVLRALGRVAEAAQIERKLFRIYLVMDESQKKWARERHDDWIQLLPKNCEEKAFKTLVALAKDYQALGEFDKALAAAEDAAALKGIHVKDGDFVSVNAEPFYQQLKTEWILVRLILLNDDTTKAATAAIERLDKMALIYAQAGRAEGIAWAFGEKAKAFPTKDIAPYYTKTALAYRASGVWYRLAAIDSTYSLRMSDTSLSSLSELGTNPLPQLSEIIGTQRDLLAQSSAQFNRALEMLEGMKDEEPTSLRMTLTRDISETEELLGNFEAAAKAQEKLAFVTDEQIRSEASVIAWKKAAELWRKAACHAEAENNMRGMLVYLFKYQQALLTYRTAAVVESWEGEGIRSEDGFIGLTGEESTFIQNRKRLAAKQITANPNLDDQSSARLVKTFHLERLAREVQAGNPAAFREFVYAAVEGNLTTPEDLVAALQGQEGMVKTGIDEMFGRSPTLLTALRRAATNPEFGRRRDARARGIDVTREARR